MAAIGPFSIDMYLPALPMLGQSLGTTAGAVQASLAVFFLGMALGQIFYGPIADRYGRRLPLFIGLGVYTAASLICALAPQIESLIAARLMQALGGCAGMVIARAVVRDVADERGAIRLMARLMLVMGVAPIIAPIIGGTLLGVIGWRGIFLCLTAYGAILLLVIALFLPETLPPERRRRDGLPQVFGVWRRLLGDGYFMGHALAGGLVIGGMFAYIAGSPFVFMELYGVLAEDYGFYFGANAIGIMLVGQVTARLVDRVAPARMLTMALSISAVSGIALLGVTMTGLGGFAAIIVALFVYVSMIGAVMPLTAARAMAPHGAIAGNASALMGTLQFGSGALAGVALGALQNGTALPMALVIALCGAGGWLVRRFLVPGVS
ncbi:MAG: multidrug effflux MFS transporter [Roseomonas sp.]|nr:multidrug effflux MFS transporter [Roseomonas sp.]